MSKLIDVFLYSGIHEHDMVRLRYMTLKDHVDEMVAISCDLTYQGEPSLCEPPPDDLEDLRWSWVNAIPPERKSEWGTEHWGWVESQHRNLILDKLPEMIDVEGDDIVMLSDMDEIVDPKFLSEIVSCTNLFERIAVPMRMHGFALDYLYPTRLLHTTVSKFSNMAPQDQRDSRYNTFQGGYGWHLSWLGDLEAKKRKVKWFSHGELQDLDVEACWHNGTHANGEELIKLNQEQISRLSWPEPILTGEFIIPSDWWSPQFVSNYVKQTDNKIFDGLNHAHL